MAGLEGSRLGNYELIEHVGSGGMAEVYRARQLQAFDRDVAIKIIKRSLAGDPLFRERFLREAQASARLDHPHILPLIEVGQEGRGRKRLFLVMPYIRGGTLRDLLARTGGPLSAELIEVLFSQMAQAVQYAHEQGLVHRDIKPSNILLQQEYNVLLADFGIALDTEDVRLTSTGMGMGTPEYTAPEQAKGLADRRSDLYGMGIVLFEMLTGRVPFTGRTAFEILFQHTTSPVPALRSFSPRLPGRLADLDDIIQRALAKEPDQRFQTALALSDAVQEVLAGGVSAEPSGAREANEAVRVAFSTSRPELAAWSPPNEFLPLPALAPDEAENKQSGRESRSLEGRRDTFGEWLTIQATFPARVQRIAGRYAERRRAGWRRNNLLLILASLAVILLLGAAAVFAGGLLSGARNGSLSAVRSPAASHTQAIQQASSPSTTNTQRPSQTVTPSPSPSPSPSSTTPPTPQLMEAPPSLTFSISLAECPLQHPTQLLSLQNTGGGTLNWQASLLNPAYLSIIPTGGSINAGASTTMTVSLVCPVRPFNTTDAIQIMSNVGMVDVLVTIMVS